MLSGSGRRRTGGWSAEVRGVTGDGVPTAAVNLLTRLDDNAYVWQSVAPDPRRNAVARYRRSRAETRPAER